MRASVFLRGSNLAQDSYPGLDGVAAVLFFPGLQGLVVATFGFNYFTGMRIFILLDLAGALATPRDASALSPGSLGRGPTGGFSPSR